jgi:hypothetical protein
LFTSCVSTRVSKTNLTEKGGVVTKNFLGFYSGGGAWFDPRTSLVYPHRLHVVFLSFFFFFFRNMPGYCLKLTTTTSKSFSFDYRALCHEIRTASQSKPQNEMIRTQELVFLVILDDSNRDRKSTFVGNTMSKM